MDYKGETLYLKRYVREYEFKYETVVFDYFAVEDLLGEKRAEELCKEFALKAGLSVDEHAPYFDITEVIININDLYNEIEKYQKQVIKFAETISGDDSAYDYFPDIVEAFKQICLHFDKKELYNQTAFFLNSALQYKEEDELYIEVL